MRPTHVEIDLSNIAYNIDLIKRKVSPAQIMAVVKANAYGHGAVKVAQTALKNGASYLAVALVEEGLELRESGITSPVLVFGGELENQIKDFLDTGLEITVFSRRFAELLSRAAVKKNCKVNVHVKVDTGMGRVGVPWQESLDFICDIYSLKGLEIKGIYTHFATSDEKDKAFALAQLDRFHQVLDWLRQHNIRIPLVHAANSGAIIDMPYSYFNIVRPGIMMYGYYPSDETTESIPVKPAMTFKSKISYIKEVQRGTPVSYGRTYVTKNATRIATLPVGYADGYNRLLSNKAKVIIRGTLFPVVGRVCMDQILIDLGDNRDIQEGDEVILFGSQGDAEFSVKEICEILNTIPYEVCCWISKRVPRLYKGE